MTPPSSTASSAATEPPASPAETPGRDFVVVANRLPVDVTVAPDGEISTTRAPGGLVTALAPLMREADGGWVGWAGQPDLELDPF